MNAPEPAPHRQRVDSWTSGESAENGEIIATEARDIANADDAEDSAGTPAGDVFGMRSVSNPDVQAERQP
jgi:hypothetical protein